MLVEETVRRGGSCERALGLTGLASSRYRLVHFLGVVLIMGGIGLSLVPKWHAMSSGATQWAVVVLLVAALPSSAAFIKIETEFAAGRMEVLWGWFTINCWQVPNCRC